MAYKNRLSECDNCFEEYVQSYPSQKYCRRKCYFDWRFDQRSSVITCTCGKEIIRYPSNPNSKYCSRNCYYNAPKTEEFKQKLSKAFRGENHPNWKGGIMRGRKDRNLMEYKEWRKFVFARDNYTCVFCEARNHPGLGYSVQLEADHIKSWSEYPELRYEVSNGRTLCRLCHSKRTGEQHKERMNNVKAI